ncbi:NAD(P)/FAD-dependent oxidoreductase [Agromyces seonyuensis]|uniref:FAD-dependent oxidoreductase n=1 Tax=Agromyces seonyuensis TaxID=2662446 RepID=A0A6I4P4Y1_9MICO|nr:NAD(P)/FAD-dependent oxidoreductase [Agromyces seonyuensis]MWC00016.1 FAD-dependent oxidoreductase [Agromyces seonyuensis]
MNEELRDRVDERTPSDAGGDADVVIVGGGPAGLSAALSLGRARRRVVVIDSAEPRNRTAAHMHGVLGHDGLSPLVLLERGRAEAAGYGVRFLREAVRSASVEADGLIEVQTAAGMIRTRRLLVATGLEDALPDIPGFQEQWGRGVVVCPYCDGWEHRDDVVGIVATSPQSVHQAQLLRQWSHRVVYFENVVGEASEVELERLERRGIRVVTGPVSALRIEDGDLTGVEVGGNAVDVGVVFTGPTMRPRDELLRALGAATTESELGSWVDVDADGRTSVPGVWAVGNVVNVRANVSVSLGLGSLMAGALNADLVADDIARLAPATLVE